MKKYVLIVGLALFAMPLFSQKTDNLLKVKGESILYYTPEDMEIVISIEAKDYRYANCSDMLIRIYNSIVNRLVAIGIDKDKIKSGRINFSENTKWVGNERVKDGYIGNQTVNIVEKYTNEQLTKIVNTLKADTLYSSYSISFQLSENQKNEALKLSIEGAIKDAAHKAEIIANATNVQLIKIRDINYNHTSSGDNLIRYFVANADYASGKETNFFDLTPVPIEITKSIDIIWGIKGRSK